MIRMGLMVVAFGTLLSSGCQKVELKEFSPDPSFKVMMPEKKKEETQNMGGMPGKTWVSEFNDGHLGLVLADLPGGGFAEAMVTEELKNTPKAIVASLKGEITSESDIKLADKYPGRQFEAKVKIPKKDGGELDGIMKGRVYVGAGKIFMLIAYGKSSWMSGEEVGKFLDSLQILK